VRVELLLGSALVSLASTTPLFAWSVSSHLPGSKCADANTVSENLSRDAALSLLDLPSAGVVVAFIADEMSTGRAAMLSGAYDISPISHTTAAQAIQEAFAASESCVSAPFVSASEDDLSTLLSGGRSVITLPVTKDCATTIEQATAFVRRQEKTLVVLKGADMEAFDGVCMSKLSQAVQNVAEGTVVSLFSSESAGVTYPKLSNRIAGSRRLLGANGRRLLATNELPYPGVQYTTPTIAFGIVVSFFMLYFVYMMAFCIISIDSPQRFPNRVLSIAKES
jgi:hypothetical protein